MRRAFVSGITGQDGTYLTELLLAKGYEVHGLRRRSSMFNTGRIDHLIKDPLESETHLFLHHGDLTDSASLFRLVAEIRPDEIYNLGAQSHVAVSFESPEYTANADALGTLRLLEAIRAAGLTKTARFYQASTSELFGKTREVPQCESTPFYPRSPYGVAKLYSYWITVNYREAYGIHASNGILFNHESPLRGETFVTRKITRALSRIAIGLQHKLYLGNLDAKRDWGHARDYVMAQWLILQHPTPLDLVVATGRTHSVREFCERAARYAGMTVEWQGTGVLEKGIAARVDVEVASKVRPGDEIIAIDPSYFRLTEVDALVGDAQKARELLGWQSTVSFEQLIAEMMEHDLARARFDGNAPQHSTIRVGAGRW